MHPREPDHPPSGDYCDLTDAQIMRKAAAGNLDAFDVLVRRHQGAVFNVAAKMLGDISTAEDITQQVFIRIYRNAGTYQPSAKFTTWIFTIVRNLVFNECARRKRRRGWFSMDAPLLGEGAESEEYPDERAANAGAQTAQRELEAEVEKALAALPENQRLAIVMLRDENASYEQVAQVLGVSLSSVKSLVFRARETLRQKLSKYLSATSHGQEG